MTASDYDKYGYGDASPESGDKYGYGDASPESGDKYGYGDASPASSDPYGYGDASPDSGDKYGYGDATPASGDKYGYGDATPDDGNKYGYGDATPAEEPAPAPRDAGAGGRNRYRRRGSVTKYSIDTTDEVQKEYDTHQAVIEQFRSGMTAPAPKAPAEYMSYSTPLKDSSGRSADRTADFTDDEDDDDDDFKKYQATSVTDLYLQQQLGDDEEEHQGKTMPLRGTTNNHSNSADPHKPSRVKKIFKGMRRRLSIDY